MYRQLLPQPARKFISAAFKVATAFLMLASLYGCGNKGDLYLPEDTATTFRSSSSTLVNQSEL